jgi:hypothetical protein
MKPYLFFIIAVIFFSCSQSKQVLFNKTEQVPQKHISYKKYWDAYENFAGKAALSLAKNTDEQMLAQAMFFVNLGDYVTAARIYSKLYLNTKNDSIKYSGYRFINSLYSNNYMWDKLDSLNKACALDKKDQVFQSFLAFNKPFKIKYCSVDTLNINIINNLPVISLEIDGNQLHFLLDTGSPTQISESAADKIQDIYSKTIASPNEVNSKVAIIKSFDLGKNKISNLPIRMLDKNENNSIFDGIIGWDLLSKFNFTIDFREELLVLSKPKMSKNKHRNLSWFVYPIVKAYQENGTPLVFGINTGSQNTTLNKNYFETGRLEARNRNDANSSENQYASNGKSIERRPQGRRGSFFLDDYLITCHEFDYANRPFLELVTHGIIGTDIFLNKKIHFDCMNGRFEIE